MKRTLCAAILAAALCMCLAGPALAAAVPDPLPPVDTAAEQMSAAPLEIMNEPAASSEEPSGEASSDEPSEEPSEEPTAEPEEEETPLPLVPGRYEGEDGGVLNVKEDGTCTYETVVSGTVNGRAMSGRLTFHGTVENGEFSFTKVTFFGLDLTRQAKAAGYTDAAHWEQEAAALYAAALAS